jgi:hypothetical protein
MRWLILALAACGRISFDPITTGGGSPTDARRDSAGAMADGTMLDAFDACSFAIPVTAGVRSAQSTCKGRDLIDACGPASTEEVLFAFMPPTTTGYNIAAYDPGTTNISNSPVRAAPGCTTVMGSCTALLGTTLSAGTTYYFAVESASGGCKNIEFSIQ